MKIITIIPEVDVPNGDFTIIPETEVKQTASGIILIEQDQHGIRTTLKHLKEMVEEIEKHL